MKNALRDLRVSHQIPAKEIVAVVQELYPKYDKTLQSKCERAGEYGIALRGDAMRLLHERFDPSRAEAAKRKRGGGHRFTCRISCRLPDGDFETLQLKIKAEGYATMQDWIAAAVQKYINKSEEEKQNDQKPQ